jgi:soluble lytic murein transglycosylase-like protein
MQIDDRYHRSFLLARFDDSTYLWADPTFNIMRGARLLAKNQKRAGWWPASVAAYNAGLTRVMDALRGIDAANPVARMAAVDSVTTGKDYASDVFRRMAQFGGTV